MKQKNANVSLVLIFHYFLHQIISFCCSIDDMPIECVFSTTLWKVKNYEKSWTFLIFLAMWSNSTMKDAEVMRSTLIVHSTYVHFLTVSNLQLIYITFYLTNPQIAVGGGKDVAFVSWNFWQEMEWNRPFFQKSVILQKCDAFFLLWISL